MNRETLDEICERGILALLLAILVFTPLAFGGRPQPSTGSALDFLAANPFLIAEWLMLAVMVLWLARLWINPSHRLLWPPICWAVVAFTLYAIFRYRDADIEYVARNEMLQVVVYCFFFFAVLNHLHRQESTQLVAFTLIFLAMALAVYAGIQFLTGSDRVWHLHKPYPHRGSGTFISPNNLAGFLELLLPLGLAYTLTSRLKPLGKIFLGYASVVILGGIGVTLSRGGWIASAVALLLFFVLLLFQPGHRLPALALLLLLVGGGYFTFQRNPFIKDRFDQMLAKGSASAEGRTEMWPAAVRIWHENVWWGAGPAHFDYRFRMYRAGPLQRRPDRPHNDFLNTLVDWGIVGTSLVAAAWGLLLLGVIKTWRFVRGTPRDLGETKSTSKFAFVLGASAGLVAILVHSLVDFNMHIPANALVAVALMALLSSHLRFATERFWVSSRRWSRILTTLVLAAGLVYLGQQTWRHSAETWWLTRAARAPNFSPAKAALLEKAFAVEPKNFETAWAIGKCYETESHDGGPEYRQLASRAMEWYDRSMKLNKWDGYAPLQYGLCLDWLDRVNESGPYFDRAEQLDPNGYYLVGSIGLHYIHLGDYAAAKPWFERSLRLLSDGNDTAANYLDIVNRTLMEAATNDFSAGIRFSTAPAGSPPVTQ